MVGCRTGADADLALLRSILAFHLRDSLCSHSSLLTARALLPVGGIVLRIASGSATGTPGQVRGLELLLEMEGVVGGTCQTCTSAEMLLLSPELSTSVQWELSPPRAHPLLQLCVTATDKGIAWSLLPCSYSSLVNNVS